MLWNCVVRHQLSYCKGSQTCLMPLLCSTRTFHTVSTFRDDKSNSENKEEKHVVNQQQQQQQQRQQQQQPQYRQHRNTNSYSRPRTNYNTQDRPVSSSSFVNKQNMNNQRRFPHRENQQGGEKTFNRFNRPNYNEKFSFYSHQNRYNKNNSSMEQKPNNPLREEAVKKDLKPNNPLRNGRVERYLKPNNHLRKETVEKDSKKQLGKSFADESPDNDEIEEDKPNESKLDVNYMETFDTVDGEEEDHKLKKKKKEKRGLAPVTDHRFAKVRFTLTPEMKAAEALNSMERYASFHKPVNTLIPKEIEVVRVINNETNEDMGNMSRHDALHTARQIGLDLVLVKRLDESSAICRLTNYKQLLENLIEKKEERDSKLKEVLNSAKVKKVRFKGTTQEHDLKIKCSQIINFLADGKPVQVAVITKETRIAEKLFEKVKAIISGSMKSASNLSIEPMQIASNQCLVTFRFKGN